ncbi:hypothetical protein [Parasphingorhabdus sp.]|uniref:hypothetical protein n=1 Tax=Parasphingorhabdus sp. TaxID=2709688 RepID=UPI0030017A50
MLGIAISTFFVIAFLGSAAVIAMMFLQYRDKIASVIQAELQPIRAKAGTPSSPYRHRTVKTPQLMSQHRSLQTVPLRAAA